MFTLVSSSGFHNLLKLVFPYYHPQNSRKIQVFRISVTLHPGILVLFCINATVFFFFKDSIPFPIKISFQIYFNEGE